MALRVDRYPNNAPRADRPGEQRWPRTSALPVAGYRDVIPGPPFRTGTEWIGDGNDGPVGIHDVGWSRTNRAGFSTVAIGRDSRRPFMAARSVVRHLFPLIPLGHTLPIHTVLGNGVAAVEAGRRYNRKSRYPKTTGTPRSRLSRWCPRTVSACRVDLYALSANTAGTPVHTPAGRWTGRRRHPLRPTGVTPEYAEARSGPMSLIWPEHRTAVPVRAANGTIGSPIGAESTRQVESTQRSDTRADIDARRIRRTSGPDRTRNKILFDIPPPRAATLPYGTFRNHHDSVDISVVAPVVVVVPAAVVPATAAGTYADTPVGGYPGSRVDTVGTAAITTVFV
jgi:hypothetical protein